MWEFLLPLKEIYTVANDASLTTPFIVLAVTALFHVGSSDGQKVVSPRYFKGIWFLIVSVDEVRPAWTSVESLAGTLS